MKTINFFINERFENNASNKEAMFLYKDGVRQSEGFTFNTGEKALLIKYDTDGYGIQIRGIVEIEKVLKNSIKIKSEKEDMTEFVGSDFAVSIEIFLTIDFIIEPE